MKRIFAFFAAALLTLGARADEGMWLLPLLKSMNIDVMQQEGCRLNADQIYSINPSSLKDAIVQFDGGCTGEIISDKGLLVTNHHCGYSSILKLSTTEHNYLVDGFWALSLKEELPVEGLEVLFLVSMEDVTDQIKDKNSYLRKSAEAKLVEAAEEANPNAYAEVVSFYDDNVFYLVVYKKYTDVRLVGTPPASIGKFGGDTDNWEWPRHTGDFSMFRVYADKKGEPAEYSPANVPLRPKQHLKISLAGVQENDFTMVMGYPGSTQRFQTAPELENMLATQAIAIKNRVAREEIMWDEMCKDPAVNLMYAEDYSMSTNGRKKWQGEELAFAKLDIIGREKQKEADFLKWVAEDPQRQARYGTVIDDIAKCVDENSEVLARTYRLFEGPYKIELVDRALTLVMQIMMQEQDMDGPADDLLVALEDSYKNYYMPLDKKVAAALLKQYREDADPKDYLDSLGGGFDDFATIDMDAYVDYLYGNSAFASFEKLTDAADGKTIGQFSAEISEDPGLVFAMKLYEIIMGVFPGYMVATESLKPYRQIFTEGLMEWQKGQPSYPDANFTMRLTWGHVLPYSPRDGVDYQYFTTLKGVFEKEDPNNPEFIVPDNLHPYKDAPAKAFGRYADKDGTLHLCFLTNNDITGGNSGSPVLNAKGELIGLAFDGNWESMSSDVMFEPDIQRCICVDIRYVLFCVEKLGGAKNIIKELDIVKKRNGY